MVIEVALGVLAILDFCLWSTRHAKPPDDPGLWQRIARARHGGDAVREDGSFRPSGWNQSFADPLWLEISRFRAPRRPIDKVVAFYVETLKKDDAKTISTQDDSKERQVALRVIVVNRIDTSTTLVISRAEGDKETHIAWSHHIRFPGAK